MIYYQPSFSSYKPTKLKHIIERIVKKNGDLIYNLTNDKLKELIIKIINNDKVTSLDIEKIIFNFEKVIVLISENKLNLFFKILNKHLQVIKTLKEKLIIQLIYDKLIVFYSRDKKKLTLLKQMGKIVLNRNNHDFQDRYSKFFKYNGSFINFLEEEFNIFLKKELYLKPNINYNQFCNLYKFSLTSKISQDLMKLFFNKNIEKIIYKNELNDKLITIFKHHIINIDERKNIYNKIFYNYSKNQISVKDYNRAWFTFIKNDLKNPHDFIENWYNIKEDYINMMKKWLIVEKLEELFSGKDNYNQERLNFWKGYSDYLKNITFYEYLNKAIIMKTDKHIFIEFGEVGNSFFIYNNNNNNLIELNKIKNTSKTNAIYLLKHLSYDGERYTHSGKWFFRFKEVLHDLGYNSNSSVINYLTI